MAANHKHIDWKSLDSLVLLNDRLRKEERSKLEATLLNLSPFNGHVWLATSGSTCMKWVALSKRALLLSAEAVNKHLESVASDIWINPLPYFHVGGLGISARAYLSGAKVVDDETRWDPEDFCKKVPFFGATLTSLVPSQVYDLVAKNLTAPASLRAVIVGGGVLHLSLYLRAIELGWKLLPSYGLTECASQVATAALHSWQEKEASLLPLSHVQCEISEKGFLRIWSESLFTAYALEKEGEGFVLQDPKVDGWFETEDRAEFCGPYLKLLGRSDDQIKIGGESVSVASLEKVFEELKLQVGVRHDLALVAIPDERLGHVMQVAVVGELSDDVQRLIDRFQQSVLPFERIREVHVVPYIPRSALNKIFKTELIQLLKAKQGGEGGEDFRKVNHLS